MSQHMQCLCLLDCQTMKNAQTSMRKRRLRQTCTNVQTFQSLPCSHKQSTDEDDHLGLDARKPVFGGL